MCVLVAKKQILCSISFFVSLKFYATEFYANYVFWVMIQDSTAHG